MNQSSSDKINSSRIRRRTSTLQRAASTYTALVDVDMNGLTQVHLQMELLISTVHSSNCDY